jgi:hypothetical protein
LTTGRSGPHDGNVDEPRGRTIDGTPWEEARGPHLPDRLTRFPRLPLAFTALAIAMGILSLTRLTTAGGPFWVGYGLVASIPSVVAFLLPAALFRRHPDAWRTLRLMVVGSVLFGVVEVLQYVSPGLSDWFTTVVPPPVDLPFLSPLSVGFSVVVGLLGAMAPTLTGRGLAMARRYENDAGSRRWWLVIAGMTVVAGVTQIAMLLNLSLDIPPDAVIAYFWITVVGVAVSLVALLGWSYLAGTAVVGWRSGEDPVRGWRLAALAGFLVLVGLVLSGILGVVGVFGTPLPNEVGIVVVLSFALGYLALLGALLAGLPETDED